MPILNLLDEKHIVNAIVRISGRKTDFVSLRIEQEYGQHHHFWLQMDRNILFGAFLGSLTDNIGLIGTIVHIDLQHGNDIGSAYVFRGVVTQVKVTSGEGSHGYLVLEGSSPTVMLDRGKRMDVYSDMTLRRIFEELSTGMDEEYKQSVSEPAFTGKVGFLMQYNETDWEFLQRLAYQYGENLFYSGSEILFGQYKEWEPVRLTYDKEITDIQFVSRMLPNSFVSYHYQAEQDTLHEIQSPDKIDGSNAYLDKAAESGNTLSNGKPPKQTPDVQVGDPSELEELVKRQKVRTASQTVYITGQAKTYKPSIGRLISVSMPNAVAGTKDIGTYRVVKSIHIIDQNHRYSNEFEAVPSSLKIMPVKEPPMPVADSVLAIVRSNEDPLGQGRIQVDFSFATQYSDIWLRVMTPDAGRSDTINKNRGMVFIPEKGDQVMIGFELGNPNRPYVKGSMFHGNNGMGGGSNNASKGIITRSGTKIIFDDAQGSLRIEDPSGNSWFMDGNGSIQIHGPHNFNLSTGGNIHFSAGNGMTMSTGADLTVNVGNRAMFNIMQDTVFNTAVMRQLVTEQYTVQASKALINTETEIKIESREAYFAGMDKLFLHSDQMATLNSMGVAEMKGETKNSFDNKGLNYEPAQKEIDAKVIVHFRPESGWKGEFGFDWIRTGDTSMVSGKKMFCDNAYEGKLGAYYKDARFNELQDDPNKDSPLFQKTDPRMFNDLKLKYDPHIITWRTTTDSSGVEKPEDYYCPWISIYPHREVKIRLLIEVVEAVDEIRFEPNNANIKVTPEKIESPAIGKYEKFVTIKCEGELTSNSAIAVKSYKKDGSDILQFNGVSGKLLVWKNDASRRKKEKVVFVSVIAKFINNDNRAQDEENNVGSYLNQALIELDKTIPVQTSIEIYNHAEFIHYNPNPNSRINIKNGNKFINQYFDERLAEKEGHKYDSYFKVYIVNDKGIYNGFNIEGRRFCVVFSGSNDQTAIHEILHGLGLAHTFANKQARQNAKITYEFCLTDNFMDYSYQLSPNGRKSMFVWQWEIINNNLKQ